MSRSTLNMGIIKLLVIKDWQLYQKQLAAYVVGLLVALTLIGAGKPWSFYIGALLLLVLLFAAGGFAIGSSLMNERKEQTLPFIMSLPVTPADFFWAKILSNFSIYLVPFVLVVGGMAYIVLFTPLPDGLLVYSLLIFAFMFMVFCLTLCIALVVESEGWNIFAMIALMTMLNPYIFGLARIEEISAPIKTNNIVWSASAVSILAVEFLITAVSFAVTSWIYRRKSSFL